MSIEERSVILTGDALDVLRQIPDDYIDCCVTSPPYYGLRNYGVEGQIGLEESPEQYISKMVEIFREVRRTLRQDGTLWLNIGDSYAGSGKGRDKNGLYNSPSKPSYGQQKGVIIRTKALSGYKRKDLIGIPCVLAGSRQGGIVLDPFIGSGTTAVVAAKYGRGYIGIDLNPEYTEMARSRVADTAGGGVRTIFEIITKPTFKLNSTEIRRAA